MVGLITRPPAVEKGMLDYCWPCSKPISLANAGLEIGVVDAVWCSNGPLETALDRIITVNLVTFE